MAGGAVAVRCRRTTADTPPLAALSAVHDEAEKPQAKSLPFLLCGCATKTWPSIHNNIALIMTYSYPQLDMY